MKKILIASGGAAYDDPWHPFARTSGALEALVAGDEREVTVSTEVARELGSLNNRDLVILNLGSAQEELPTDAECVDGLLDFAHRGGAVLAMHVAATAFPQDKRWETLLGGRWVQGRTHHPEFGLAEVHVTPSGHPASTGVNDFLLEDERYTDLRVSPSVNVLATHLFESVEQPLVWVREEGGARIAYDALGHDERSYDSEPHGRLVRQLVGWLLKET
jgi:type 1 glutamine amidotransferase